MKDRYIMFGIMLLAGVLVIGFLVNAVYGASNNPIDEKELEFKHASYGENGWKIIDLNNDVWEVEGNSDEIDGTSTTLYRVGGWHKYDRDSWYSNVEGPTNENKFIVIAGSMALAMLACCIGTFLFVVWKAEKEKKNEKKDKM